MQKPTVTYVTIDAHHEGQRIDNFLITKLKGVPKTRIYRILRKGEVRVNKKRIDPSYKLNNGDEVRIPPVTISEKGAPQKPSKNLAELLKNRILFEDAGLLIINKPHGIPVHGGTSISLGVVEALRQLDNKYKKLELAHRLDRETSGCLILSKKNSVLRELHTLMREGKIVKKYLALTKGVWKPNELRVNASLEKNYLQSGERMVKVSSEGKESLTTFRVLNTWDGMSLVEATLHTGRTHQIRVHAQYRKHYIAGDEKYGDKEFNKILRAKGLNRMFLHAYTLSFTLPSTGQMIEVRAPLDPELEKVLVKPIDTHTSTP